MAKLYTVELSPPARAVLLLEKALDLEFERITVNMRGGEQMGEEYLKMNPQHTIPTFIDEDGTIIWDSHAIMAYIVEKYAPDDSLYPKDLAKRAVVDQRLHFDSGNLFSNLRTIVFPMWTIEEQGPSQRQRDNLDVQYNFLDTFVSEHPWMAGDSITIADFSIISSVTSLNYLHPIDEKYTHLWAWIKRCEELPYYEENERGVKIFGEYFGQWVIPLEA